MGQPQTDLVARLTSVAERLGVTVDALLDSLEDAFGITKEDEAKGED